MRNTLIVLLASSALGVASPAAASLVIHTTPFITTPSNFNGFEGIGANSGYTGPYTEDGITVEYASAANDGGIWTTSQSGEGIYSWYPNGGDEGYTSIKLASGGSISAIEFLAGSGFGNSANLAYDLLLGGASVASGVAGSVPAYRDGFVTYGFSGIAFDEVRLQANPAIRRSIQPHMMRAPLTRSRSAQPAAASPSPPPGG